MTNRAWRVVIVDDEPLARQTLRLLLTREPDFLLAGESTHAKAAIEAIGTGAAPSHSEACAASSTRSTRRPA